ncbi:MAG: 4-alpha-glucanotransferase [Nitrospira sp.]|nr:MAG: 4-alpha-glucanotransferase [Nitrospira sp.]
MASHSEQTLLDALAECYGIVPEYHDNWGARHIISAQTKRDILRAMGVRTDDAEALQAELAVCEQAAWVEPCDPVLVVRDGEGNKTWSFRMPAAEQDDDDLRVRWELRDERGASQQHGTVGPGVSMADSRWIEGRRYVRVEVPVPVGLPLGYYDIFAWGSSSGAQTEGQLRLIVAPSACYAPIQFEAAVRGWGLVVQLYTLRSGRNWGVGDLGDLAEVVDWAATDLRADVIGVNPLHALRNERPYHISPYNPTSRLYFNGLYVDVERIPEWTESAAARRWFYDARVQERLERLRAGDVVDYDAVSRLKREALDLIFTEFESIHLAVHPEGLTFKTPRGKAFLHYIQEEGEALEAFAVFLALMEEMHRRDPSCWDWHAWPEAYRRPDSPDVGAFREAHASRVRFFQFVQWVMHEELDAVMDRARRRGLSLGLYHDMALGSDRSGSDAWVFQDLLALGADCGCPPDAFALDGQNWGLPPVVPSRLRAGGYRMFIAMIRKGLKYGGALRLDHVMGLFRLFWIPRGLPASAGAYVQYPWEDLLAILALESVRHQAVIVGEDLGTVPDWVKEKLTAARVLSYKVLYFERAWDGSWKKPSDYPAQSLAVVTTHDLPTLAAFWSGADLELRASLGLYQDEAARKEAWQSRHADRQRLLDALRTEGLWPEPGAESDASPSEMTPGLSCAIHTFLARTPSWITLVTLEDLIGQMSQVNVPGTVEQHPNWSRKIPSSLEVLRLNPSIRRLTETFRALRGMA